MNILHLRYLCCPKTGLPLLLTNETIDNNRVKEGILVEPEFGNKYPIINFIPRFVPSENYSVSFGFQWNIHDKTQYDENSNHNISRKRFLDQTKWGIRLDGELLLEAGSGSGRFTGHVVETGAMVISFDYSSAVDANYKSNGHLDNLLIVQASIYEMPFKKRTFDKVLCIGVLQHTPNPRNAFEMLVDMIKSKGQICTDIYQKNFTKICTSPKYLIRKYTAGKNPEKLYAGIVKYIDFIWPLAKIIRKIPKIGKSINWRLMVADYSRILPNADEQTLKQWAYLDTMDMLSPMYDFPQTLKSFQKWHKEANLRDIEVQYGYNGIEARARKE